MDEIKIKPVNESNWKDFETLFESRGCPHHCWCTVWRLKGKERKLADKVYKKNFMAKIVKNNLPIGLLAYADNDPIAWCSIAPRETYRDLGGDETKSNVWSLTCLFIKRDFRKMGLARLMIEEAKKYAKRNGSKYLEAYPVLPGSHSYRFMGFVSKFEKAGFQFSKMVGLKRHVMITEL